MIWRVFTLFLLSLCAQFNTIQIGYAGSLSWVTQDRWVTVSKVIDGDTFATRDGERVRLLGINTPEIQHDTSPAQPFGNEAKALLTQLIDGQVVRLSFEIEKQDKYGRTLAHVYHRNGLWVNEEMLRLSSSFVYTFPPNIVKASALVRVEQQAIQANQGIWQTSRWRVLLPEQLDHKLLGQFRLVQGEITALAKSDWQFAMGKLTVSVPKKYRKYFRNSPSVNAGDKVLVRGILRMSKKGKWFLSAHAPSDIKHIKNFLPEEHAPR